MKKAYVVAGSVGVGSALLLGLAYPLFKNGLDSRDALTLAAVFISFSSLCTNLYISSVSKIISRTETYRQMRAAFFEFRHNLPDRWTDMDSLQEGAEHTKHFKVMVRYWQFAFDEWFITTQLNPHVMRPLWVRYYKTAIARSANSGVMLAALFDAFNAAGSDVDKEFLQEVLTRLAPEKAKRIAVSIARRLHIAIPKGFGLERYESRGSVPLLVPSTT